jgi:hypothetical protein
MRKKPAISYAKQTHAKNTELSKSKTPDMGDSACRVPNIASVALAKRFFFNV